MNDLKITLIQADQIWENKTDNLHNYDRLLSEITTTDLIILPEMFNTGFSMNASQLAENHQHAPSIDWLKKNAHQKNVAIYTSLIFEEHATYYNRGVFVFPNGTTTFYDKRKTFSLAKENEVFSQGNKTVIVKLKNWNIQLQICYDLRFPEISLNQNENGKPNYDLLIYIANWPKTRRQHWLRLIPARAIENQCYVVAVNRIGTDAKKHQYSGDSCVFDLQGNELVNLGDKQKVQTIALSYRELQLKRKTLPFLKDRVYTERET